MADFSNHQKKIIKRYYDNREQLDDERLAEMVANLYLAEGKKQQKLWESARETMLRLKVPESRVEHILQSQDPAQLAELVQEIQKGVLKRSS